MSTKILKYFIFKTLLVKQIFPPAISRRLIAFAVRLQAIKTTTICFVDILKIVIFLWENLPDICRDHISYDVQFATQPPFQQGIFSHIFLGFIQKDQISDVVFSNFSTLRRNLPPFVELSLSLKNKLMENCTKSVFDWIKNQTRQVLKSLKRCYLFQHQIHLTF